MTTVAQLIDQVNSHLHSFTGRIEAATWIISNPIGSSDTNIYVQHPERVRIGIIEIDDELIQVSSNSDGLLTTFPDGRGVQGSTAAAHAVSARITNDPQFPRVRIFDAIKRGINTVKDELFYVKTNTITSSPVVNTYDLWADVGRVLQVQYKTIGPSQEWRVVRGWSVDENSATASGKALVLTSLVDPGSVIQVTYAAPYVTPTATTDDLESTCNIPASAHEVLLWYACAQLVQFLDVSRLDLRGVEQQARAQGVAPGDSSKIAAQMFNLFDRARLTERKRLLAKYPPAKHVVAR